MICPSCKQETLDGSKFCEHCGAAIPQFNNPQANANFQGNAQNFQQRNVNIPNNGIRNNQFQNNQTIPGVNFIGSVPPIPPKKKNKGLIIGLAVGIPVFLIVLVIILILIFGRDSTPSTTTVNSSSSETTTEATTVAETTTEAPTTQLIFENSQIGQALMKYEWLDVSNFYFAYGEVSETFQAAVTGTLSSTYSDMDSTTKYKYTLQSFTETSATYNLDNGTMIISVKDGSSLLFYTVKYNDGKGYSYIMVRNDLAFNGDVSFRNKIIGNWNAPALSTRAGSLTITFSGGNSSERDINAYLNNARVESYTLTNSTAYGYVYYNDNYSGDFFVIEQTSDPNTINAYLLNDNGMRTEQWTRA